jgi:hypothetical protein
LAPYAAILDRILIMNAAHLRKVLAEYETYFNEHRPHRALNQASPLRALPDPLDADITVTRPARRRHHGHPTRSARRPAARILPGRMR